MYFIMDLIVVFILIACVFTAYKRGLAGCVIKIISFFIAIFISALLFKPVSNIVIDNTNLDENIQNSIVQVFEQKNNEEEKTEENNNSPILQYVSNEIEKATEEKKNEIVNSSAKKISINIVHVLVFISLFILARILLIFVKALTNLITKLPLIKQCDKIGGIIYGILQGLIIIYIILAVITFISTLTGKYELLNLINESYIASKLCSNNILLNIIF